jgi:myo-inositol-1(or 4)-monophosphatase
LQGSDGGLAGETRQLAAVLREAGVIALKTFQTPLRTWLKDQSSPVSEADIAVDGFLRERLAGATTGCGWLSEETADDRSSATARRLWIVDPIDGTRAYLAGRPDWAISAALVEDGRPVLAGVFAPVTDELFVAAAGMGATRNGAIIRASAGDRLAGAKVAGPRRWRPSMRRSRCRPASGRSRCGSSVSRRATSTSPLRPAAATTGTLRVPTFWCTKPAGR